MSGVHRRDSHGAAGGDSQGTAGSRSSRRPIAAGVVIGLAAAVVVVIHLLTYGAAVVLYGAVLLLAAGTLVQALVHRRPNSSFPWMPAAVALGAAWQLLKAVAKQRGWPPASCTSST